MNPSEEATLLARALSDALNECIRRGLVLPFYVALVGLNGSVLVVRMEGGAVPPQHIVEHLEDGGFAHPINIMVVDARGEAGRVVVGADGKPVFH